MAHSTRTTNVTPIICGPLDLLRRLRKVLNQQLKRRQVVKMLDCDERILKDMGITRGDVIEALSKHGNESLHLRTLAARRRFWTRNRERIWPR